MLAHRHAVAKSQSRPTAEKVNDTLAVLLDIPAPFALTLDSESQHGLAGRLRTAMAAVQVRASMLVPPSHTHIHTHTHTYTHTHIYTQSLSLPKSHQLARLHVGARHAVASSAKNATTKTRV